MTYIRIATLALVSLVAFAAHAESYEFDVQVRQLSAGGYILQVSIYSPDGPVNTQLEVRNLPSKRTVTHTVDNRTYTIVVDVNPDGSAVAAFEVADGNRPVARATKNLPALKIVREDGPYKRLSGAVERPEILTRVEPIYPSDARAMRISGIVIVEAKINANGTVDDAVVLKPLPFGLDKAALDAVRQWTFKPAMLDGKPVPVVFNVTVSFRLE